MRNIKVAQAQPNSFQYSFKLHQNGELENARLAYHEILKNDPDNHIVMNALACIYQGQGKNQEALELYTKAANFSKQTTLYKFNIAITLMNLDRTDEALVKWDNYISLVTKNAGAYRNRAWIYWRKKNMLKQARDDYQESLKYWADHILTYCELIQVLTQLDELQEAESYIDKAIALVDQNNDPESHELLAITFMGLARNDAAIIQWNKYLSYVPDSAEGYHHRGLLLWEKGEKEQAQSDYQLAIKYAPDHIENY